MNNVRPYFSYAFPYLEKASYVRNNRNISSERKEPAYSDSGSGKVFREFAFGTIRYYRFEFIFRYIRCEIKYVLLRATMRRFRYEEQYLFLWVHIVCEDA